IYRQREEINERMAEMFSVLKEYTNEKALEKEGEEVEKCDEVIDIEVVEQSKVLGDEGIREEEEVDENELDRRVDDDPTKWGKYKDKLIKMPRSHLIGFDFFDLCLVNVK
ncbi:hypothetical protein Tco_1071452, partial [Tanacetum coccineum]